LDWASLLKRVFGADLKTCTLCGSKRKVIATIYDGPTAQKLLRHLGLKADPLNTAPARAPPQPDFFEAA
jgi:hypothetical protein